LTCRRRRLVVALFSSLSADPARADRAIIGAWAAVGVALKNNGVWERVPTKIDTKHQYTRADPRPKGRVNLLYATVLYINYHSNRGHFE
jgi:hypothetical protein